MVITAEDDKKYWDWLPDNYAEKLKVIRDSASRTWDECRIQPQLAGFTPHGPEHSKSIEDIMHRLIPRDRYKELTERERFYLLAAAWVHDLGMLRGIEGDSDKNETDDEIRNDHHKRSERFIVNNFHKLKIDQSDSQAIGLLSYFHRRQENINNCPDVFTVETETVRLRLLAAYLRLADSLDIGQSRSPSLHYAICLAYNIPMSSKLHWIKSRLISGIEIDYDRCLIIIDFKTPHESDLKKGEGNISIQKNNLSRLRKAVVDDLREELDTVKSVLIRGDVSYFLDIAERTNQMVIDNQILPEICRLVNNFEMMAHPSASKLIQIVLQTILDIISPYETSCENSNNPISKKVLISKCHRMSTVNKNKDSLKKDIQNFIQEIDREIISNRPCHVGIKRLVNELNALVSNNNLTISQLSNEIKNKLDAIKNERSRIRTSAAEYFIDNRSRIYGKNNKNDAYDERLVELFPENVCFNILVYGYSELVIKALCGFRDVIIKTILHNYTKKNITEIRIHKDNIEKAASSRFRIYVCEGQPKTITAQNDALVYHDGTRYALELNRRGFTDIIIIPDLVVGRLLRDDSVRGIDFVMLGVNGLEYISESKLWCARFLHSSGHLAVAALTSFIHACEKQQDDPSVGRTRLVLVLSASKCTVTPDSNGAANKINNTTGENIDSCAAGDVTEKEGYKFWQRCQEEAIRMQPFLARDEELRKELYKAGIRFYNPREDSVSLSMVNDIVADGNFFRDIHEKSTLDNFRKWLYGNGRQ